MLARQGMAELAKPVYDKKLWDDDGSFIQPPTIRDVIDIAVTVAVSATGFGAIAGAALNLVDDLVFAGLDIAGGYKSAADVGNMLAQKALTSAVSVGIGSGLEVLGNTNFVQGIANSGTFGKIGVDVGMAGLGSILNTTASNTIQAIDFTKLGTSDWFNTNQFTSSMTSASTWGSLASAMVGAGVTSGIEAYRDGVVGTEQQQFVETAQAVIGHTAMALRMQSDARYTEGFFIKTKEV